MPTEPLAHWLNSVTWNTDGLVPVIAQDHHSGRVLMVAWMNREALAETARRGEAGVLVAFAQKLWHKGEESGHVQVVREIRLDCDADVIVLQVEQQGGIACHTGRESCFYRVLKNGEWQVVDPVLKDPAQIYGG